jgi:mono/diheme cytochrome c family protein
MTATRVVLLAVLALAGCDDMTHQAKRNPYERESVNGSPTPRQVPPAMVAFDSTPVTPPKLTLALLQRGQAEYRQFCTPCHSELGDGHGMVVQRGFEHPPSYLSADLMRAPTQHFYDVMTNGQGAMYSFADRVAPADRWAIAAYIRALQASGSGQPAGAAEQHAGGQHAEAGAP